MDKFFNPKSIAIIGASHHSEKLGYQVLENLIRAGFKGKIYPVNPQSGRILNLDVYPSVTRISDEIDLAVVIVPAKIVPEVLSECVKKHIPYAIVISAGFSEIGAKGKILQDEITDVIIKSSPLRVLGPNCLGIINTSNNLNTTFAAPQITKGNVAAVFQSGALGVALLDWAKTYEFGFSKFISLGNKIDLEESEILKYLENDEETKIIAMYLEQISNPKKFLQVAREVAAKKPVIILKGGTTKIGAHAAFSHTAAMVTPYLLNRAIFAQANLIVAQTIEEMLSFIQLLSCEPPARENKLGIITNAGGPAIITADIASRLGVQLPPVNPKIISKIRKALPEISENTNPLDLTGEALAESYKTALAAFVEDPSIASILVILTPQTMTEIDKTAQVLASFANIAKPIVASFLGDRMVASGIEILRKAKVPHYSDPEDAVKSLTKVTNYWKKFYSSKDMIDLPADEGGAKTYEISHHKKPLLIVEHGLREN